MEKDKNEKFISLSEAAKIADYARGYLNPLLKPKKGLSFVQATILVVLLLGAMFLYNQNKTFLLEKVIDKSISGNGDGASAVLGEATNNNELQIKTDESNQNVTGYAGKAEEVLMAIGFQKIKNPSPSFEKYNFINGDLAVDYSGIMRIKPDAVSSEKISYHAIKNKDIDGSSVNSRTIKNYTILGEDINRKTTPTFGGLTLNGDLVLGANSLTISNASLVSNLNSDLLDGNHASAFQTALTNPVTGTGTQNYLAKFTTTGATIGDSVIYDSGTNVGIGTTNPTPTSLLSVGGSAGTVQSGFHNIVNIRPTTLTATDSDSYNALFAALYVKPTSNSSSNFYGAQFLAATEPTTSVNITTLMGSYSTANLKGTGTIAALHGSDNVAWVNDSGTVTSGVGAYNAFYENVNGNSTTAYGTWSSIRNGGGTMQTAYSYATRLRNYGGTINNAYNYYSVTPTNTGTIGNLYQFYAANPASGGTINNNYGLYIENQTTGSTNYSIYSAGGKNYFAGNVGIGTTTPADLLDVQSGNIRNSALAGVGNRAVYSDANGVLTNSSSDSQLKKNVVNLSDEVDVLSAIDRISGIYFNWDTDVDYVKNLGSQREIGFIAQNIQEVFPELVGINSSGYLSLDYAKFTPILLEGLKQEYALILEQENRNTEQDVLISGLDLKTSSNISTLSELQDSVDLNLVTIGGKLENLEQEVANIQDSANDQIAELQEQMENVLSKQEEYDLLATKLGLVENKIDLINTIFAYNKDNDVIAVLGNMKLSGNLEAKKIKADQVEAEGMVLGAKTMGKGTIEAGKDEIIIETDLATEDSKIYITPTVKLDGRTLYVKETDIEEGKSFKVKLDGKVSAEDITFNWLIFK